MKRSKFSEAQIALFSEAQIALFSEAQIAFVLKQAEDGTSVGEV